jgi:hypothetical protein
MCSDPIVDEVRRIREVLAAKYDFDVKAILTASKKRQRLVHKMAAVPRHLIGENEYLACIVPSRLRLRGRLRFGA